MIQFLFLTSSQRRTLLWNYICSLCNMTLNFMLILGTWKTSYFIHSHSPQFFSWTTEYIGISINNINNPACSSKNNDLCVLIIAYISTLKYKSILKSSVISTWWNALLKSLFIKTLNPELAFYLKMLSHHFPE